MPIELWLAFAAASAAFLAVPMGPTVMVVVGYALGQGRKTGWATVPGVTLGDFTAMTISLLGAGAVLAASATLFTLLKLVGAAYLIWLGIRLWRAEPSAEVLAGKARGRGAMFWNAYAVTALNPQSIMFFIAFVPQFVARRSTAVAPVRDPRGHLPRARGAQRDSLGGSGRYAARPPPSACDPASVQPGGRQRADRLRPAERHGTAGRLITNTILDWVPG